MREMTVSELEHLGAAPRLRSGQAEVEDTFALLGQLKQPEYEIALLVATCGLRISEALGLRWKDILWERGVLVIRQTFVHSAIQDGAKTKLSRSRVEVPRLALDVLAEWRKRTVYAGDEDYVFPSIKLGGKKPRTATMLVQDYIRPAAIRAGILGRREVRASSHRSSIYEHVTRPPAKAANHCG